MQPFFDQDHFSLRTRARRWVDAHLIATGEQANIEEAARRLLLELAKDEFLGFTVPMEYGGKRAKVQARDLCILREELARGSALADALFALQHWEAFLSSWLAARNRSAAICRGSPAAQPSRHLR